MSHSLKINCSSGCAARLKVRYVVGGTEKYEQYDMRPSLANGEVVRAIVYTTTRGPNRTLLGSPAMTWTRNMAITARIDES